MGFRSLFETKTREGASIRRVRRLYAFLSPALQIKCKDPFYAEKTFGGKSNPE